MATVRSNRRATSDRVSICRETNGSDTALVPFAEFCKPRATWRNCANGTSASDTVCAIRSSFKRLWYRLRNSVTFQMALVPFSQFGHLSNGSGTVCAIRSPFKWLWYRLRNSITSQKTYNIPQKYRSQKHVKNAFESAWTEFSLGRKSCARKKLVFFFASNEEETLRGAHAGGLDVNGTLVVFFRHSDR